MGIDGSVNESRIDDSDSYLVLQKVIPDTLHVR